MVKAMTWTKKKPTKAGWYWVRAKDWEPTIYHFSNHYRASCHEYEPHDGPLSTADWEWFAFIPQPRKAKRCADPCSPETIQAIRSNAADMARLSIEHKAKAKR